MKLHEISQKLALIEELSEQSGGEITQPISTLLQEISENLPAKVDGCVEFWKRLDNLIEYEDGIIEERKKRQKALNNTKDRFKEYLLFQMKVSGQAELNGEEYRLQTVLKSKNKLDIQDPTKIPTEFRVVKQEIDKERLKAALKLGMQVNGATLEDTVEIRKYGARKIK